MNYFQRIKSKLDRDGLESVISYFLKKVGYKTKYSSLAEKKKILLSKKIYKITKGKTVFGLYAGTKFKYYSNCSNKLTGQFEQQVQEEIYRIKKKYNLNFLINFGAGEGFHTIGPIKNKLNSGKVFWVSNEKSRILSHKWRTEEHSILVGVQTIIDDNPELTSRFYKGNNPIRIVIDPNLPASAIIFASFS